MDMDGHNMNSQETPPNINEPYANNLITIIASIIAFLTVRHLFICIHYKVKSTPRFRSVYALLTPIAATCNHIETFIVNKFSYSAANGICPPLGAVLVTIALISAVLPLLLLNVDLKINSNRAGFLALALVPFLLSSTGKNSAVSLLTGISSVKLNFLHRVLGLALFVCATVHMACMIQAWVKFPTFLKAELALTKVQYGLAGYGCLCMVILGSFLPIRTYCYELFLGTHLLGIVFIGVIAVHTPYAMRYFIAGLFCYLLNLIAVWFVKTYIGQARFEVMEAGCTKISIRLASPMKTHHIGQHINLCVPAISPFQWHPFTITSVQQQNEAFQNTIEVCVIARGNFTRTLYRKVNPAEEMRVFVSGPFGSNSIQSNDVLETHSSIVIACGGAGITFGMRLLRELTEMLAMQVDEPAASNDRESLLNYCKTKNIYFYWSVRRYSELEWFREELEQINYLYESHPQYPRLHIKFHVTCEDTVNDHTPASTTRDPTMVVSSAVSNEDSLIEAIGADELQESQNLFSDKNQIKECRRKDIALVQGQRIQANEVLSVDNDIGAFGKYFISLYSLYLIYLFSF
jgi:hypothetical protein